MARRRRGDDEELPFSLDSFLDIVANLVGILIRLIVMVGLTVRALPPAKVAAAKAQRAEKAKLLADAESAKQRGEWEAKRRSVEAQNSSRNKKHDQLIAERFRELQRRRDAEAVRKREDVAAERTLAERKRAIAQRLAVLHDFQRQAVVLADETTTLSNQAAVESSLYDRELAAVHVVEATSRVQKAALAELKRSLEQEQGELDRERIRRQSFDDQLAEIREQIAKLEALPKPIKNVAHFGASVARQVEIEERHYRLLNGRVAPTYLHDLLEILKRKIQHDDGGRMPSFGGVCGPIGGFQLRFEVDHRASSLSYRAQSSGDREGVELRRFELLAESDSMGETEAVALAENSEFWRSLKEAAPATHVVTLWVYPDSFKLAKSLEVELHARNFTVAMRPIPHGSRIAGGPEGTISQSH